jgi:putative transcriptional regulator
MIILKRKPKNRIKELRKAKKMKQAAMADRVGILQSEISEIETGERKPNVYLARKIAKVLGKTIADIFYPDLSYSSDYDRLYQD